MFRCLMPSPRYRSPRIQLTLDPEVMAILDELSQLTGQGKATMVSELVREALPAMYAARDAIKVVKESPREAQAMLARFSTEAVMKLGQAQLDFDDLLASKPTVKRQKRKRGSDGPT